MIRRPPTSPLFPSRPLFRSRLGYPPPVLEPHRQVHRVLVRPEGGRLADAHAVGVLARHHEGALAGLAVESDRTARDRSEEHTSELQSQSNLVCRLLLEKKNR